MTERPCPSLHNRFPAAALALVAGLALVPVLSGCANSAKAGAAPSAMSGKGDQVAGSTERLREDIRRMVTDARDKVFPALVNISVVTVNFYDGKESKGGSVGSGTIISPEGYVLTNEHVVNGGRKYRVTLADRREVPAMLVGADPLTDLAVIKIDMTQMPAGTKALPYARFGESDALQVGDYVMAMGSPLALSRSVTLGIVSNKERVFTAGMGGDEVEVMEFEAGRTGIYTTWIQHDASIDHGNSGGPLVNLSGEIVGVNSMGMSAMAFAIPSSIAKAVSDSLIKQGEVVRSDIGVALKAIKRSDYKEGVLINSVAGDSPAAKAGLQAGDLILTINNNATTVRFPEEVPQLLRTVANYPVGSELAVEYRRGEETRTATITTEKLLRDRGDETSLRTWGISATEITPKMAKDWMLNSTQGAMVTGSTGGGPAATAEPSLNRGDIVRAVAGRPVADLKALVEIYKSVMSQDPVPEFVVFEFERRGKSQVTLLKPRPDKPEDPPREVPKPWIGVATQPILRDLARELGHPDTMGFRVTRVYPGTIAADSDLKPGDVIFAINGEKLSPRGMQDAGMFQRRVRQLTINDPAKLSVLREGKSVDVNLAPERTRIGPEEALKDENKDFEIKVRELTFFDRDDWRWSANTTGVLVESVENAGWAGLAGIYPGDLIQRINDTAITDIASWRVAMAKVGKDQPEKVTFVILRRTKTYFMFAEPEWKPVVGPEKAGAAGGTAGK